jgi:hypothetical protein
LGKGESDGTATFNKYSAYRLNEGVVKRG